MNGKEPKKETDRDISKETLRKNTRLMKKVNEVRQITEQVVLNGVF